MKTYPPFSLLKCFHSTLILFFCCVLPAASIGQTYYQTYPTPKAPNQRVQVEATPGGFHLFGGGLTGTNIEWIDIDTDAQGNKVSDNKDSFDRLDDDRSILKLADGTYVIGSAATSSDPMSANFRQIDAAGNILHEFAIDFPAESFNYNSPAMLQLDNGNLYIITGYNLNDGGVPDIKHFIFSEYNLNTQQFAYSNDILWSTGSISAFISGLKLSGDGKLIIYIYDAVFSNRHIISKYELDGTEVWSTVVSTLERPVADFVPTPDGGVWQWNEYFNFVTRLDADGNSSASFNLSAFQNQIQGAAEAKGIIATGDNGVLIIGNAFPTGQPRQVFTALVSATGETLQTNLFDLPDPVPGRYQGIQLADGSFALSGGLNAAGGFIPYLLRLDHTGNLPGVPQLIDLELDITGSNPNPNLWEFHSVEITVTNSGNIDATGVIVNAPTAAGEVYQGGNAFSTTQGTFDLYTTQNWNVGTLAPGGNATLTINYFKTSDVSFFQYGQVVAANENDVDSAPANGDGSNVNEDDEVGYGTSAVDFRLYQLRADIEAVAIGGSFEVDYGISAFYSLTEYPVTVTNGFYLSEDETLDPSDIFLGSDEASFTGNGGGIRTIFLPVGAGIAPGDYYLLGKLDYLEEFAEPDEDNNISSQFTRDEVIVTPPAPNLPDLVASRTSYFTPADGYDPGDNLQGGSFVLFNTGVQATGSIDVAFYLSVDQSLSPDDIFLADRSFGATSVLNTTPQFFSPPTRTIPMDTPGGEYWVLTFVDSNDDVVEATESNNVRVSNQQVTINGAVDPCNPDVLPPIIDGCPSDINLTTSGNTAVATWADPLIFDNCGNPQITSNFQSGDSFPVGSTEVTITATDGGGNAASCSFFVNVTGQNLGVCNNNLLINGGFENGLAGWLDLGGGGVSSDAIAGTQSLQVCPGGQSRVIQTVPVTPGQLYAFEFWARNDAMPPPNGTISQGVGFVKFLTANWQPISSGPFFGINNNWNFVDNIYTIPANAAYAEINFQAGNDYCIFVDEVCFGPGSGVPPCFISINTSNVQCQDNGTPDDPTDDTFTFDFLVNGQDAGSGWTVGVANPPPGVTGTGDYGQTVTQGPFLISDGPVTIGVRPVDIIPNNPCTDVVTVQPPAPCSNGSNPLPDLTLSNFNAPAGAQTGQVIQYSFDLNNVGNADAQGAFSIKAYFSIDDQLSTDDIFDGIVPTGNLAAGQTVFGVPGASTVPGSLADGNYYLILQVDADEQIAESNEQNNTISSAITISSGGGTPNCTAISDFPWHDWISRVTIGNALDKPSGKSPYSDFSNPSFDLVRDQSYDVELTVSYSYFTFDEYWRIWIDSNQDAILEAGEIVFEGVLNAPSDGTPAASLTGQFSIPASASAGPAKMRVIMTRDDYADPCGPISFGEVEDYQVNILNNGPINRQANTQPEIQLYPNPVGDRLQVQLGEVDHQWDRLLVVNSYGGVIAERSLDAQSSLEIDFSSQVNGFYFLHFQGTTRKPVVKRVSVQRMY